MTFTGVPRGTPDWDVPLNAGLTDHQSQLDTHTTQIAGKVDTTTANATYATILTPAESLTYNADGTVATQTIGGVATTYTYNADGTVHTETRNSVTRTYIYNSDGTLASVA